MKMKFFELAKKLASKSDHSQHRLGCVISKKNRIVSIGWNKLKTHSKSPHKFKSIHAEFSAILGIDPEELKGSDIYIYRQRRNGVPANSFPCESCFNMLQSICVKNIYYTDEGSFKHEQIF